MIADYFITGATGFIGSHLAKELKEGGRVIALVRDIYPGPWGNWLNEALSGCIFVRGDILDFNLIRRVISQYEIREVYHLAAQAIVRKALKDPLTTYNVNVMGTVNILEACRQLDTEKVLVMGTDKIYGEKIGAYDNEPVTSSGIYETSKACEVLVAESYMKTYDMKVVIPVPCNVYGYDLSPRIIPNTIKSCLRRESPVIFEEEKSLRQYLYIGDLVDALMHLMKGDYTGRFNIATNDLLTQEDVVKTILRVGFPNLKPKYVRREKPIKEISQQSTILSDFGWEPKIKFGEGIRRTIELFKKYGY